MKKWQSWNNCVFGRTVSHECVLSAMALLWHTNNSPISDRRNENTLAKCTNIGGNISGIYGSILQAEQFAMSHGKQPYITLHKMGKGHEGLDWVPKKSEKLVYSARLIPKHAGPDLWFPTMAKRGFSISFSWKNYLQLTTTSDAHMNRNVGLKIQISSPQNKPFICPTFLTRLRE